MSDPTFLRRTLLTLALLSLGGVMLAGLWAIAEVLLLLFLGILLAIALRTVAQFMSRFLPLSPRWALVTFVLFTLTFLVTASGLLVPVVLDQATDLLEQMQESLNTLEASLDEQPWSQQLPDDWVDRISEQFTNSDMLSGLTQTFADSLGLLADVLFILFIGLFVGIDPDLYRQGVVALLPAQARSRAQDLIDQVVQGLRAWMLGRVISMAAIGTLVGVGLALLNIPLALALGVLTGLFEFIPVVGPILSALPAILIAFSVSPMQAVYVAIFFLLAQQIEGNILTPIVQQKTVSLPPAFTLTAVLIMGVLFGPLGVLVATPLATVVFILVKQIYVEGILKDASSYSNS